MSAILIIIVGVILAAMLIGAVICFENDDAVEWVTRNFIDKDGW